MPWARYFISEKSNSESSKPHELPALFLSSVDADIIKANDGCKMPGNLRSLQSLVSKTNVHRPSLPAKNGTYLVG